MDGLDIGLLSMVAIVVLIYAGMHAAIALCLVSLIGVWAIKGNFALAETLLALAASDAVSSYEFGVVPLFVLMGLLVSVAGIGRDTFVAANVLLRGMRGGLGIATVIANAAFAAVTGISIASAAVFTKIAVPEMLHLGYRPRFAVGVVAGSSVLGMLIPQPAADHFRVARRKIDWRSVHCRHHPWIVAGGRILLDDPGLCLLRAG